MLIAEFMESSTFTTALSSGVNSGVTESTVPASTPLNSTRDPLDTPLASGAMRVSLYLPTGLGSLPRRNMPYMQTPRERMMVRPTTRFRERSESMGLHQKSRGLRNG